MGAGARFCPLPYVSVGGILIYSTDWGVGIDAAADGLPALKQSFPATSRAKLLPTKGTTQLLKRYAHAD